MQRQGLARVEMSRGVFRAAVGALALAAMLLLTTACATPVGVDRVDAQAVQRRLTTNVLSRAEPSPFTQQFLMRFGLLDQFAERPADTLAQIHSGIEPVRSEPRLFALAELSFLHADRTGQRRHYLAAAVYAYAFLFPEGAGVPPDPYDPRFRVACDLYNRGLAEGLASADGTEVLVPAGRAGFAVPFGVLEIEADPATFLWAGYRFERFVSAADLEVRGLRNRYRNPGLGAPLVAGLAPPAPGAALPPGHAYIAPAQKVGVTAFLRLDGARQSLLAGRVQGRLELYTPDAAPAIWMGISEVPLEYERSAAYAYGLEGSQIWEFETAGFLSGSFRLLESLETKDGLYMGSPYRPGKIPVVLVHGTFSSPARWADLANELATDPLIARDYVLWGFKYNSGNSIAYSAGLLREALTNAVRTLDPEGRDRALRRMVVIGHSQGGLLAKMTAINSGSRFWDGISQTPLEDLDVSEQTREILRRSAFFTPLPFVERVIFLATPHRGSKLAGPSLARFISKLVKEPLDLVQVWSELLVKNPDRVALRSLDQIPSSVEDMSPSAPFILTLASIPVSSGVSAHSIIAVQGDGPVETGDDGVVTYESAHIMGAASELVVRSGHSVQANPHAIREVRRILLEHVVETE